MSEMVRVGMADFKICRAPDAITTLGLGSCVGIVLYDPISKIAGMVHVMLPDSTKVRKNENVAKFVYTGIVALIKKLVEKGANQKLLKAKIAGGAQMFNFSTNNELLRIGDRNIEATKLKLKELGIHIVAEDVGLSYGRTIEFYPETGELLVKAVGKPRRVI